MTDFINEHIKEIFKNILYFIVGVLIVAVPVCLFFLIKGTLSDMLFSTFVFNFLYASEGSSEKTSSAILLLLRWVAPVLMMIFISSFFAKRLGPKVASFITTISIFALIPILLGFSYTHYYTTLIPLIPIYCAVFFYITSNKINILAVILLRNNGISVGKLLCSIRVKYSALLKEVVFAKSPCQNKRRIFGYLLQCKTA